MGALRRRGRLTEQRLRGTFREKVRRPRPSLGRKGPRRDLQPPLAKPHEETD